MKRFTSYYWYTSWYKTKSNNIVLIAQKNKFLCCEIVFQIIMNTWISYIGGTGKEFTQRRLRQHRERKVLIRKTTTLHVHHAFFYISLPSLHDCNVKLPNFTFCRGREQKTTTLFFFSWTLIQSFRIQLQKHLPTFDELNEIKKLRLSLRQRKFTF